MNTRTHLKLIGRVFCITTLLTGFLAGALGLLMLVACVCLMFTPAQCGMPTIAGFLGFVFFLAATGLAVALAYVFYQGGVKVRAGNLQACQGLLGFSVLYLLLFFTAVYSLKPVWFGMWWFEVSLGYAAFFTYAAGQLLRACRWSVPAEPELRQFSNDRQTSTIP